MLRIYVVLTLFLILLQDKLNYEKIFGSDYTNALDYFVDKKELIGQKFETFRVDKELLIPIIFPERIRYSIIRDMIETSAVELVYVEYGSDYIDFSIGDFQLKPSFASKIETSVLNSALLKQKYSHLVTYNKNGIYEVRKERVERLKSLEFQLIYIAAFYDILIQKFDLSGKSALEKIAFLSTSFNYGFMGAKGEIEAHVSDRYFPFGSKYKGKQYSYSDVSIDFYLNHYHSIFK